MSTTIAATPASGPAAPPASASPPGWWERAVASFYRLFFATPTKTVGTGYSIGDGLEALAGMANQDENGTPNHDKIVSAAIGGVQSAGYIADRPIPEALHQQAERDAIVEAFGQNLIAATVGEDARASLQTRSQPLHDGLQQAQDYAPAAGSAAMVYSGFRKIRGARRDYGTNIGEFVNGGLNMLGFGIMAVDKLVRRQRQKETVQCRPNDAPSLEEAEAALNEVKPYHPVEDIRHLMQTTSDFLRSKWDGMRGRRASPRGNAATEGKTATAAETTPQAEEPNYGKLLGVIPEHYLSKAATVILAGTSAAGIMSGLQDIIKGGRNRLVGFIQLAASFFYMGSEIFMHSSSQYDADRRRMRTRVLPTVNHDAFQQPGEDGKNTYDRLLEQISGKAGWHFAEHNDQQNLAILEDASRELASLQGETPKYQDCYLYQQDILEGLRAAATRQGFAVAVASEQNRQACTQAETAVA